MSTLRLLGTSAVVIGLWRASVVPAHAQLVGTFTWQQQPYCNRLTVTITPNGDGHAVDGFDDQCGAAVRASVAGTSVVNGDGTVGLGLTVITAPGGAPAHIDARVSPSSGSGVWTDATGASGGFVLGAAAAGSPRPLPPTPSTWGRTWQAPSTTAPPALTLKRDYVAFWPSPSTLRAEYGTPATFGAATAAGVFGTSAFGVAVAGASDSGIGVLGYGGSPAGVAVDGSSIGQVAVRARAYGNAIGVLAQHDEGKTALEVRNGSFKVSGTTRPAFQHTTTSANTVGHATTIDHPMANGDPTALLFVLHAYVPGATVNDPKEKSVWYDAALSKWRIYHDDLSSMPLGARFNVLVIKQ